MRCPFCGYEESKVIDSRPTDEGARIRRRRECLSCKKRFTTYEVVESLPIIVVKRDKSREQFDRNKLINSLLRACEKRTVSIDTVEKAVDEIEATLQNSLDREISSLQIGELAMTSLRVSTRLPMCVLPRYTVNSATSTPSWTSSTICSTPAKAKISLLLKNPLRFFEGGSSMQ